MQRIEQSALADHERRPMRLLAGEKARSRHGAREDMLLLDGHAHPLQLGGHVAARPLTIVCKEQERKSPISQHANEIYRTIDQLAAAVDDTVHIDQKPFFHVKLLLLRYRSLVPQSSAQ